MTNLVLFGAGGHCLSCIEVINSNNKFNIKRIYDKEKIKILDYKVSTEINLKKISKISKNAHISFGFIKNGNHRKKLFDKLKKNGFTFPVIKASTAYLSSSAKIGEGTILMHHSLINHKASIGKNCIINSKSLIEHGVKIENNCHISTGVIVNGDCKINSGVFIGSGTVINQGVTIGQNCIIGSGLVIKKNIKSNSIIK